MNDPTEELLAGHVLADLSPAEWQELASQVATNPALASELAELETAWHSLAYACESVTPPPVSNTKF